MFRKSFIVITCLTVILTWLFLANCYNLIWINVAAICHAMGWHNKLDKVVAAGIILFFVSQVWYTLWIIAITLEKILNMKMPASESQ